MKENLGEYLEKLKDAITELLQSESSEGCTDDLTVVSSESVEKLRALVEGN